MKKRAKAFQPDRMSGYRLPVYEYRTPPEIARGVAGDYPVIVVGAGLGGLTAALELEARGVQTVLLDDDITVGAAGLSSRCICYAKRSLEVFDRFGVAERVRAKGVTWNEGDVYRGATLLYHFNLQPETDQKFPAFVNLQQFYVEQYLVERIQQTPGLDLRWKNKVVNVRQDGDSVEVTVETPDGRYKARCRYLVAADGAHSAVRRILRAKDAYSAFSEDYWCISDVRMAQRERAVRKVYLDNRFNEGGAIWYHQMADGVWRTDWQIAHYLHPETEASPERAKRRLRKLLGPKVKFELVWVGPWRFRKRYLARMVHGRVLFLGDAAGQHSPFGALGGNRAIQDANNLGWKLPLVLAGKASPDLVETYNAERHYATRMAVEIASRSATFIGPESGGQGEFRNAVLDLAQRHPWARELVNVGRLSTACTYVDSPLNVAGDDFEAPLALPGAAAPDGRMAGGGFFIERVGREFTVAWFGGDGGSVQADVPVETLSVPRAGNEALFARYGVGPEGATYVFRPDGHVLGRRRGMNAAFARDAIRSVLGYRSGAPAQPVKAPPTIHDRDRLYDEFSAYFDGTGEKERTRALARLVVALARRLPSEEAAAAVRAAREAASARGRAGGKK
jgi:3-(3-hydroxy-phenyl)propionate hydroxylase